MINSPTIGQRVQFINQFDRTFIGKKGTISIIYDVDVIVSFDDEILGRYEHKCNLTELSDVEHEVRWAVKRYLGNNGYDYGFIWLNPFNSARQVWFLDINKAHELAARQQTKHLYFRYEVLEYHHNLRLPIVEEVN